MTAKRTILFFLLLSALIPTPLVKADPGWLTGWTKRVKITIDSGDIDTALTDFPILIYLSDSSGINGEDITFVFDEVGANSLKIAVTLSDGTTECYTEIEKWDLGNERAWIWTKISAISNLVDTEVYLYYDNNHADNNAYVGITNSEVAENVWDPDFLMVQHQAGDSSPIRDSTDNDNDMTETGDPTYQQSGPIDGEVDYDGSDYHVSAINVFDPIVGTDKGTIELWIKTIQSTAATRVYFSIEGAYSICQISGQGGVLDAYWSGTHNDAATTTTQINTGAQFYLSTTYDGANQRVFVNAGLEDTDACNLYDVTALNRPSTIASQWDGTLFVDGNIDEVRISKIDRSASWIKATYETGQDDLIDFGSEEIKVLESPTNLFGAGFNSSSPYVDLYWKSNLTTISFFEVQNSTDKVSWDYLGQSTTRNYKDYQVVNGLERYYRVRACNFTGGAWDNSSFTDINFEKVYFVSEGGGLFPGLAIGISLLIIGAIYALEKRR